MKLPTASVGAKQARPLPVVTQPQLPTNPPHRKPDSPKEKRLVHEMVPARIHLNASVLLRLPEPHLQIPPCLFRPSQFAQCA